MALIRSTRAFGYDLRETGVDQLPGLLNEVEANGFSGVNIMFPVKQAVLPHFTELGGPRRGEFSRLSPRKADRP
jgi:Shikimate 5-dehydrogenase